MKTDINMVTNITKKMKINDLLYKEMQEEYGGLVRALRMTPPDSIPDAVESLYFPRRVLSLLSNQDLPLRCAVGLYAVDSVLSKIAARKDEFIGDSDTDTDIMTLLLELGYRAYDKAAPVGSTVNSMYLRVIQQKKGEIKK